MDNWQASTKSLYDNNSKTLLFKFLSKSFWKVFNLLPNGLDNNFAKIVEQHQCQNNVVFIKVVLESIIFVAARLGQKLRQNCSKTTIPKRFCLSFCSSRLGKYSTFCQTTWTKTSTKSFYNTSSNTVLLKVLSKSFWKFSNVWQHDLDKHFDKMALRQQFQNDFV